MFPGPGVVPAAGVRLGRDETVVAAYAGVTLLAVDRPAGVYSPEARGGFSYRHAAAVRPAPVPGGAVLDQGTLTVTTRRLVFAGGRGSRREWALAELAGLEHHRSRPVSFLHLRGVPVAGLEY